MITLLSSFVNVIIYDGDHYYYYKKWMAGRLARDSL